MGAEIDTAAAMDTDKDRTGQIPENSINRAGSNAVATVYAEFLFHDNPTASTLGKGAGRTGLGTRCRITGQTVFGGKTGAQAA